MAALIRWILYLLVCPISLAAEPKTSLLVDQSWQHNRTQGDARQLHPGKGEEWSESWIHFTSPIEVDEKGIVLTYSVQTDRARGEDAGAVYAKFHFTKDTARREQVSINATTRPSDRWYMLYVDPGWELPNRHYRMLLPPGGLFARPTTPERFRVVIRRQGEVLIATLAHWNTEKQIWQQLAAEDGQDRVAASIESDLERQTSVKSLSFQFPADFSIVTSITLERGAAPTGSP